MKHLLFAALLLICLSASAFRPETDQAAQAKAAQTAKTATTLLETNFKGQPIDAVTVGHSFDIVIRQGSKTGVQYSIDSRLQPYLICKLENGQLTLGFDNLPQYLSNSQNWINEPTAIVTVRQLKALQASGAAKVKVEGQYTAGDFTVKTSGAAKINGLNVNTDGTVLLDCSGASHVTAAQFGKPAKVSLDASGAVQTSFTCQAKTLSIDASGGAKISASGSASHLSTDISGAVKCNLSELKAGTASCSTSGASHIDCWATGQLSATASGASRITCKGNPQILKKEASKASSINVQ